QPFRTIGHGIAAAASGDTILVAMGTYGGGNINANPLFVGGIDFHLQSPSPCINAGTADAPLPATDLDRAPRLLGPAPDMGAYELWRSTYGQWFVDRTLGNDTTGAGSPTVPYATVVRAIGAANNGHSIYIKRGNYGTDRPRIIKTLRLCNWGNTGLARV